LNRYGDLKAVMDLDIITGYKLIEKAYKARNEDILYRKWLSDSQIHGIAGLFAEQAEFPNFAEYLERCKAQPNKLLTESEKEAIRNKSHEISQRLRGE
jgi:hypothetical protein